MKVFKLYLMIGACMTAVAAAQKQSDNGDGQISKNPVGKVSPRPKTRSRSPSNSDSTPISLPELTVTASSPSNASETAPIKLKYQFPQTSQGITAQKIQETINVIDTEDALKYFPSLFLRKRNYGDTQATLATRTWGVNSSARSLVYADDMMLSALVGNNNTIGAPRWGMVSPEEIDRIDFLYGPFAAAYPGNSMGGVLQITTKMPDKAVADFSQTQAVQTYSLYGTKGDYGTEQSVISYGDKNGNIAWLVTGNFQTSFSQPLTIITNGSIPAGTTGAYVSQNKTGAVADVVGSGGLLHTQMFNASGKVVWDITPTLKATYQASYFNNDANSRVQTYIRDDAGNPTYGGVKGFANGEYTLNQTHLANAVSLKTDTQGVFDLDFSLSNYYYLNDIQRNPYKVGAGDTFATNGTITRLDGTNWTNSDLKGIWRPTGVDDAHEVSFGLHSDRYYLNNPTYGSTNWESGPDSTSFLYSKGEGTTMTDALWIQDAWRFAPNFKLTLGGRFEYWEAFNGYNLSTTQNATGAITGTSMIHQTDLNDARFSPKAAISFKPSSDWELAGSFGQAYRFPTVTELYQTVTTGPILSNPNPNLNPENVLSEEIALERKFSDGQVRMSLFNENVHDAIISQTNFTGAVPISYNTNVDSVRNTGMELAGEKDNVFSHGVDLFGSVTYVDSEILKDPSFATSTGTRAEGKHIPYVPDWRATLGVTFHPTEKLSLTAAARYSGQQYSTLDNTDHTSNVFGAFDDFVVVDLRAQYKINENFLIDMGIDNVNNAKYYLYHPFPQRTYTAQVKFQF